MATDPVITAAEMLVPCGAGSQPVLASARASDPPVLARELSAYPLPEDTPSYGCRIEGFQIAEYIETIKTYIDRASALALAAAKLTLGAVNLLDIETRGAEIGLAYATAWGCLDSMKLFYAKVKGGRPQFAPPLPFTHAFANSPSSLLAIEFGLRGYATTHSAGWTCGAQAIGSATDAVALGSAPAILVGGSEALSAPLHLHHDLRGELSPTGRLAPGEPDADGLVLGEGAAFVLLETSEASRREPLARLAGWGAASGGESEPAVGRSVELAVEDSGIDPAQIKLVLTGACGLPQLDQLEREQLAAWAHEARASPLALPATALTGALSGASAAFATALASHLIAARTPLEALRFAAGIPFGAERPTGPTDAVLVSSFDPGGASAALVIAEAET
jgi:3-oxoacyl-[acyl-carrier-protein] synthase II